jgi:hypothetical protein
VSGYLHLIDAICIGHDEFPQAPILEGSHLPFTITHAQRQPNKYTIFDAFRADVMAHARRKARFAPDLSDDDYGKIAPVIFGYVHEFLRNHETVTYDSYVRMMLVYFIRGTEQVEGPDMQATLRNEHFGINARVTVAYDLSRLFMNAGF